MYRVLFLCTIISSLFAPQAQAGWFSFDADQKFDPSTSPSTPNFSTSSAWAVSPGTQTLNAPLAISKPLAANADVFYIAPTVFLSEDDWNADPSKATYRKDILQTAAQQVGMFNGIARFYIPLYRQATLYAFVSPQEGGPATEESQKALDLAYEDVANAFDYYMAHENHGRALFIVSHSQGSYLAVRLLQNMYRQYHLNKILVAAYVVGENIGTETFGSMLKACQTPSQTNCFATWKTLQEGSKPQLVTGELKGRPVCINPLTFSAKEPQASQDKNLGSTPESLRRIDHQLVGASCNQDGYLVIKKPDKPGYPNYQGDYHESDFNLFYTNIGLNADLRLKKWEESRQSLLP